MLIIIHDKIATLRWSNSVKYAFYSHFSIPSHLWSTVPGIPQNLACAESLGPSELFFSWDSVKSRRNERVRYNVNIKRLAHRQGTREVIQVDLENFFTPAT